MADKTATQNLTRAQSTDRVVDYWQYLKTLAIEADQRMTSHYYDLDRQVNSPFCVMRLNTPVTLNFGGSNAQIIFDTVDEDTGDMADPSGITISLNTAGYWEVGFYLMCTGLGGGTAADMMTVMSTPQGTHNESRRDGSIEQVGLSGYTKVKALAPATDTVSLAMTYSGTPGAHLNYTVVTYAEMWAYKYRDV